jgi:hypothetical protein
VSIQYGKATKYTSAAKAQANAENPFQSRLRPGQLNKGLPPRAYQHINVGPETTLEFEENLALPVDGSNPLLRNLSPFLIQIEPPLVFANEPKTTGKGKATGIFDAAISGSNSNLGGFAGGQNAAFLGSNELRGNASEVLVRNAPDPKVNKSGDGGQLVDGRGRSALGKLGNPTIADLKTALDIVTQLAAIQKSPPLVMLINPNNLSMNYTRVHQFSDRSRFGYIYQAWGEEQPRLSINAKCGAFYSGGRGVHVGSKRDSAAWQNLMSLFHFYRSNGYIYDTLGKSNAHLFVGGLSIHYDGWIYYGHMESFSWTYDETNQLGGIEFQIEFVCSVMVDTSKQTQTVLPMSLSGNATKLYRGAESSYQQGAHTLDQWFGGADNPGNTPVPPGSGDPDFVSTKLSPQKGQPTAPKGGGFVPKPVTAANGSVQTTARPERFRRG